MSGVTRVVNSYFGLPLNNEIMSRVADSFKTLVTEQNYSVTKGLWAIFYCSH